MGSLFCAEKPRRTCLAAVCVAIAGVISLSANAAEETEAEKLYTKLSASEQSADKTLARRWQALVRQRQWSDKSGKHKVFAKYVDHDPDLKWVKLLIVVKSKDGQSTREAQIDLAKLGKGEQTLVKQISLLKKKVEEAAAAAPATEDAIAGEGAAPGAEDPFGRGGEGRPGELPPAVEGGEAPQGVEGRELPQGAEGAVLQPGLEGRQLPPGYEGRGLPPSGGAMPIPRVGPAGPGPAPEPEGPRDRNTPRLSDDAVWRTDFNSFAANLSATKGEDGKWAIEWGELADLKAAYEASYQLGHTLAKPGPGGMKFAQMFMAAQQHSMAASRVGEVLWETTISEPIAAGPGGIKHDLQLPEPLGITLVVDDGDVGDFNRFQSGDRVKFIGRFHDLGGAGETPRFTLYVRFPDEQGAAGERGGIGPPRGYTSGVTLPPDRR
jgi:hypothetical protein